MFCTNCGAPLGHDANYCMNCGTARASESYYAAPTHNAAQTYNAAPPQQYGAVPPAYPYGGAYPPPAKVEKPKNLKPLVIIIAIAVVLVVGLAFYLMWFFGVGLFEDPNVLAIMTFEELAWEMDNNGGLVSLERVVEVLGVDYEIVVGNFSFSTAPEVRILAISHFQDDEMIGEIAVVDFPSFMHEELPHVDEALLREYERNSGNLNITLEYLESIMGRPGIITRYSHWNKSFTYTWMAPFIHISAYVNNQGEVYSVSVRTARVHTAREDVLHSDDLTEEERNEIIAKVSTLVYEMEANGGFISKERAFEIIGEENLVVEHITTIVFLEVQMTIDVSISLGVDERGVYSVFFRGVNNLVLDEDLVIDADAIRAYVSLLSPPSLDYFEALLGGPGTILFYNQGRITYIWVSSDYVVYIWLREDGDVMTVSILEN